jgi:hypothetical protein
VRFVLRLAAVVSGIVALSCGGVTTHRAPFAGKPAAWTPVAHVRGVFDLAAPRRDGAVVVAARTHLISLRPGGSGTPFASIYASTPGLESYIALAGHDAGSAACRFPVGTVYALHPKGGAWITAISPTGQVQRFAQLPSPGFESGIAFDTSGLFRRRLLVTATHHGHAAIYAIDCHGDVQTITRVAPPVEGGIAVAPPGFGRFAGQLIAPDEHSGNLYAISASGRTSLLARSGLPHGGDIGVESLGFVPAHFNETFVADRGTPGNPHPGDNAILALRHSALTAAGVRSGDLLAVAEASALTIAVRCARTCAVRQVAAGPHDAHIEGHVIF